MEDRIVVIGYRGVIVLVKYALVNELGDAFMGKIRIYRPRPKPEQRRHLMHVPWLTALKDNGYSRSLLCHDKMLLHRRYRKK